MFLSRIAEIGLIEPPEDENILKHFDENIRRTVAWNVMTPLTHVTVAMEMIATPTHAQWVMEAVGQGFLLPFLQTNEQLMVSIFTLYQTWLNQPEKRPKGIRRDEQHFIRKIVLHFSLLFEPRQKEENETELDIRCKMCRTCLKDVYLASARAQGHQFTRETWDCYLKTLLGVTDQIMTGHPFVLKKLGTMALRVLFDIWIMAKTTDDTLWNYLYTLVRSSEWVSKTLSTTAQWVAACIGMTKHTLGLIYGHQFGTTNLQITFYTEETHKTKEDATWELTADKAYFYWRRFLHLLGNPNNIIYPSTYSLFTSGIASLVDCYIKIATHSNWIHPLELHPPTINTVLDIFGNWLFEAMLLDRPTFEEGTATATATVSKIFCDIINTEPINPKYLATFFTSVAKLLTKKGSTNSRVLYSLLIHSRRIFVRDIPGSTVLIPYYFNAIARVWYEGAPSSGSICGDFPVGVACAETMTSLACFPNRYRNGKLMPLLPDEMIPIVDLKQTRLTPIHSYDDMFSHYKVMLKTALHSDSHSHTLQTLLWCFTIVTNEICSYYKQQKQLLPKKDTDWITEILNNILAKLGSNIWLSSSPLLFKTFECLSFLRLHCISQIKFSEKITEKVLLSMITFIMDRTTIADNDLEQQRLVSGAYQCIRDWLAYDDKSLLWMTSPTPSTSVPSSAVPATAASSPLLASSIITTGNSSTNSNTSGTTGSVSSNLTNPSLLSSMVTTTAVTPTIQFHLIKAIKVGLESGQNTRSNAAQQCLNFLLNMTDIADRACVADESDLLYHIAQREGNPTKDPEELYARYRHHIHWFGLDEKTIISLMDYPATRDGPPSVIMIVRNEVGKFMWQASLSLFASPDLVTPDSVIQPNSPPKTERPPSTFQYYQKSDQLEEYTKVIETFAEQKSASTLQKAIEQLNEYEVASLEKIKYGLDSDIGFKVASLQDIWSGPCKLVHGRIFLAHLGLSVPRNLHRLSFLDSQPRFIAALKQIDSFPEREPIIASIIYVRKNQRTQDEIFSNTDASQDFKDFISSLGWLVQLNQHTGLKFEEKRVDVSRAPYYADSLHEFIFLVSIYMSNQWNKNGANRVNETITCVKAEPKRRVYTSTDLPFVDDVSTYTPPTLAPQPITSSPTSAPTSPRDGTTFNNQGSRSTLDPDSPPPAPVFQSQSSPGSAQNPGIAVVPPLPSSPPPPLPLFVASVKSRKQVEKSATISFPIAPGVPPDTKLNLDKARSPGLSRVNAHRGSENRDKERDKDREGQYTGRKQGGTVTAGLKKTASMRNKSPTKEVEILSVVEYKRRELINTKVVILWIEDILDYSKDLFIQERDADTYILIIIQPLKSGLYAVHIPRENSRLNGSLLDFMILAKHQLGTQIRRCVTIAHCWINTNFENGYWREPHFLQRNNRIQGALRTFTKDLTMRKFYSNQFTKFDSKSGGSLTQTPRKEGEISLGEFRLQFKYPNTSSMLLRSDPENEDKSEAKKRNKPIAKPLARSKGTTPGGEKKEKKSKQELEPIKNNKSVRWSNKKPTTPTLPAVGTVVTNPSKTPNPTPKKPKQSARREKPPGPIVKDKEKIGSAPEREKEREQAVKQPAGTAPATAGQKDPAAKPNVPVQKSTTANKKGVGLAGKIKEILF